MSDENPKDQASLLRQRMEYNNEDSDRLENNSKESDNTFNVLNLPPRSQVHVNRKTGTRWKVGFPLIRLLFVLFLLIIGLVLTYNIWGRDLIVNSSENDAPSLVNPAGEMVTVMNQDKENVGLEVETNLTSEQIIDSTSSIHVVQEGETLSSIAEKYYGTKSDGDKIIKANELIDKNLTVGQRLIIPNYNKEG